MLVSLALSTPYLTSWPCKACRAARREAGPEPPRPQPRLAAPLYALTLSLSLSGRERERETRRSSPPLQAAAPPRRPRGCGQKQGRLGQTRRKGGMKNTDWE